jgi:hypothetical protein
VPASVDADASMRTYESDRQAADRDLQQIAVDPANAALYDAILDSLGRYESEIGQAVYLAQGVAHQAPAQPPAAALALYTTASGSLHATLLSDVSRITQRDDATVSSTYAGSHADVVRLSAAVALLGLVTLGLLLGLSRFFARRFRRILSPALVACVVGVAALAGTGAVGLGREADHLQVAKPEAYDSINALTHARALSYDANADESRWLLENRAPALQTSFFAKVTQILQPGGLGAAQAAADPALYYSGVAQSVEGLAPNVDANRVEGTGGIGGYLGTELGNITFPGEARAAVSTMTAFSTYIQDDGVIRADANRGDIGVAVSTDIGTGPNQSNYAYGQYDAALQQVIGINQDAYDGAISAGLAELDGWTWLPVAAAFCLLALVGLAVRPRLREYQ